MVVFNLENILSIGRDSPSPPKIFWRTSSGNGWAEFTLTLWKPFPLGNLGVSVSEGEGCEGLWHFAFVVTEDSILPHPGVPVQLLIETDRAILRMRGEIAITPLPKQGRAFVSVVVSEGDISCEFVESRRSFARKRYRPGDREQIFPRDIRRPLRIVGDRRMGYYAI